MPTKYMRDRVEHNQMLMPWVQSQTISTADAAVMMQSSKEVVRALLEEGKLQGYRMRPDKPHSPWRVSRRSVELYVARLKDEYALADSAAGSGAAAGRGGDHRPRR